ncbi:Ubiquitin carboxyl-terminal hydrolase CYLD [Dissostichus eleginoides]|uniref:ubiquitinyl hydrolase 1 n=1 Tax=Dissostichus eleginoides TaxID=100907 RepID=A0AAD9F996_DISEL|nr:Ubiquitin carboxyl-terminal hydrolase CYLD [Dissostichus eleginoides]
MFLISTDLKVQDQLDGTIKLLRGFICQEQEAGRSRGDSYWVKVLDNDFMLKIEKKFLLEVPSDLSGLLEAVSDPEARLKLLRDPGKLQTCASLPVDSPLWVQIGQQDELAEADLKYIGPRTRGSSAVYFGVQLKGSAAGKGSSNGFFKGQRLFSCPEACALFLPVSHVHVRTWTRNNVQDAQERAKDSPPVGFLPRTAESAPITAQNQNQVRAPASPPPLHVGQRVMFPIEDNVYGGEVRFCGLLPGRSSSGMYVGILLDAPVGQWDGLYKGEKLCNIPSLLYGALVPINRVSSDSKPHRHTPPHQVTKSILKPVPPPSLSPSPCRPPTLRPKSPSCPPANKGSPVSSEAVEEDGEAGLDGGLEVGSMVEVNDPPLFGVIRWIGRISGVGEPVAGIELDQDLSAGTDGSYLGERHFRCPANKGLFVKLRNCRRDSRFPAPETPVNQVERCNSIAFAEWGSERVEDNSPPVEGEEAAELYEGWKRGIQGHLNSCYLDATLFSSADWVLFWPSEPDSDSGLAQDLLRCEIVNPLRRYGYVCASKTMALRRLLEAANSNMDPEEFLNKLFQLLQVEPLLKIITPRPHTHPASLSMTRQSQEGHLYQLFPPTLPPSPTSPLLISPIGSPIPLAPPSPNRMRVASVQTLLESSFLHAGLKFVEDFKMFDAILPTLSLDITDLLDDTLRQCSICQAVAEWECLQCYEDPDITPGRLKQYCSTCNTQVHSHRKRASHHPVDVTVPGVRGPAPAERPAADVSLCGDVHRDQPLR